MIFNRYVLLWLIFFMAMVSIPEAFGGAIFDVGIRGTYEDNINGSPADANKKGDFYTVPSASLGGYTEVLDGTYLFLRVDGASYFYRKYDDLNSTIGGVVGGVYQSMGDILSAQVSLKGVTKSFKGTPRDSKAYGGTFELKQQITQSLWIKEGYEYEKNEAESLLFSYKGQSAGIWAGYLFNPETMLNLGYSYLARKYEDSSGFKTKSHTISASIVRRVFDKIYLNAGYDRQYNDSNISNTDYTNNIYSIGASYSY